MLNRLRDFGFLGDLRMYRISIFVLKILFFLVLWYNFFIDYMGINILLIKCRR